MRNGTGVLRNCHTEQRFPQHSQALPAHCPLPSWAKSSDVMYHKGVLLISCGDKRLLPGLSDGDQLEHVTLTINLGWCPDSLYFFYSFSWLTPWVFHIPPYRIFPIINVNCLIFKLFWLQCAGFILYLHWPNPGMVSDFQLFWRVCE